MKKFLCVFVALAGPVFAETDYVSSKTVRDIQLGQPNNNAIQNLYVAKDARVVGNLTAKAATSTNHVPTWKQVTDYATTNAPNNIASNWSYHVARSNVVLNGNWLSGDGGNEGVSVRANGNVGVGTTNPVQPLHVTGAGQFNGSLFAYLAETNALTTGGLVFKDGWTLFRQDTTHRLNLDVYNGGSVVAAQTWTQNGNVGIGTTNPATLLDVNGTATVRGNISIGNNWLSGDGGNEGVSVRADGNVGVGTTNPLAKFYVANAASGGMSDVHVSSTGAGDSRARLALFGSNNAAGLTIDSFSGTFSGTYAGVPLAGLSRLYTDGANGLMLSTAGGKPIVFTASDGERVRLMDNGNVGVGITNPVANLQVTGNVAVATTGGGFGVGIATPSGAMHINANEGMIRFSSNTTFRGAIGHDNGGYFTGSSGDFAVLSGSGKALKLGVNANNTPSASILANGNFGIGTTNPATMLDVGGPATIRGAMTVTNSVVVFGNLPTSTNGLTTKGTLWVSNGVLGIVGY